MTKGYGVFVDETLRQLNEPALSRADINEIAFRLLPLRNHRELVMRNHALGKKQGRDHPKAVAKLRRRAERGVSE